MRRWRRATMAPATAEAWARFCAELDERIRRIRDAEGVDSRETTWRTFSPPLGKAAKLRPLPIGYVGWSATNARTMKRGYHGRVLAREG